MTLGKPPTSFSITAAHRVTGKSRTTLQRHLKSGKLSCTTDAEGNKLIDAAELIRVYGDACDFSRETEGAEEGASAKPAGDADGLRKQLELINEERRREREQLRSQIEHLQEALKLAQEGHNRATLLLENRGTGAADLEGAVRRLEDRLEAGRVQAQKELDEFNETSKRQLAQLRRGHEAKRPKPFWPWTKQKSKAE